MRTHKRIGFALLALALSLLISGSLRAAARFGALCQQEYQNSWQQSFIDVWDRCTYFNNQLDNYDTKVFYYNLQGAKSDFSTCDGCAAGADNVHLLFVDTHGMATPNNANPNAAPNACLAMWNQNVHACSANDAWRFGNNATKLAFLAQYSCETLKVDDKAAARWVSPFKGGLIMAVGSHGTVYDGEATDEAGEDFAEDLQSGLPVEWAWFDGLWDSWVDQDVAVMASGSNKPANNSLQDCKARRDFTVWQTFGGLARWRDNDMVRLCMNWITDF